VSAVEAGRLCHVAERTIRRWVAAGHLPADTSGPTVRIVMADLQAYIAAATATPPDPGQAPRPPSGRLTVLRPDPDGGDPAPDARTARAQERPDPALNRPDHTPDSSTPLVARLESEVAFLRQQLTAANGERAELRRLLALALQTRALPEPREENSTAAATVPRPWWAALLWWRR
jgi:excisionase family DNA binding protein